MGGVRNVPRSPHRGQLDWGAPPEVPVSRSESLLVTSGSQSRADPGPTEEVLDTRSPAGPEGRVYATPFARVWDELLSQIGERSGWMIVHSDEDLGLVTVRCQGRLPGRVDDLAVWVSLDGNGLTRVDLRLEGRGRQAARSGRKRVRHLLRALDTALGPHSRVRG